jgi:hypothetical protein
MPTAAGDAVAHWALGQVCAVAGSARVMPAMAQASAAGRCCKNLKGQAAGWRPLESAERYMVASLMVRRSPGYIARKARL